MNKTQIKVTCFYNEAGRDFLEIIKDVFVSFLKVEKAELEN